MEREWKKKKKKEEKDLFHVIHKVPCGDGPYVRAKYAQNSCFEVVEKDPEGAIVWFWKAINAGDRIDSALKDMAAVMKQLHRAEDAIDAISSFRSLCPTNSQESLDNILIDLYKKCGRVDEEIELLKRKLKSIYLGEAFNGKPTKTARSHGKKFQLSIKQETSRILRSLAWAYMQQSNFVAAESVYRKAQTIEPDANKALNLCHCLMKQGRYEEASIVIGDVLQYKLPGSDEFKSRSRAEELSSELDIRLPNNASLLMPGVPGISFEDDFVEAMERAMNVWAPPRSRRLPVFEEIAQFRDQLAC